MDDAKRKRLKKCKVRGAGKPKGKTRSLEERNKGFTRREAIKEARRCLGLSECESCEACSLLCPDLCITRSEETGEVQVDLDYCKGCGICASICPKGAIEMVLEEGI